MLERRCCVARSNDAEGRRTKENEAAAVAVAAATAAVGAAEVEEKVKVENSEGGRWVKGSGPEPHFIFMQLLISVEPDTRRVPNLPPPVPLSTLLPATRPSPFGQLDLLPPRLLPPCAGELPSAPFAAGWRRVTSLSKNGRCRLSLSCSGLSFPRPRAHLFLPSVLLLRFLFPSLSLSSFLFFFLASLSFPFYPFFRCFSFSHFLSASLSLSHSTFLRLRSFPPSRFRSQTLSPQSSFSLSPSSGRRSSRPLARGHSRVRWSSLFTAAVSTASSIVARTPALSRGAPHWRVDGGGRGIGSGG